GIQHFSFYQNASGPYQDQGTGAMVGTVFQGNSCTNCPVEYTLSGGTIDATIWNAATIDSPGIVTTFLADRRFSNAPAAGATALTSASPVVAVGTLVGND
ncbi:MAG: hypothetical protein ACLPSF_05600, partial [Methylocella sp.]